MEPAMKNPTGFYLHKPTKTRGSRYEVELKRIVKDGIHVCWKTTSSVSDSKLLCHEEALTNPLVNDCAREIVVLPSSLECNKSLRDFHIF